jgi:hypothetical protein
MIIRLSIQRSESSHLHISRPLEKIDSIRLLESDDLWILCHVLERLDAVTLDRQPMATGAKRRPGAGIIALGAHSETQLVREAIPLLADEGMPIAANLSETH